MVNPESIPKTFTIVDYVEANVSSQAGIKDNEEVNVFKNLVFITKAHSQD